MWKYEMWGLPHISFVIVRRYSIWYQTGLMDSNVFSGTLQLVRFVKSGKGKYKDNYEDWDLIERRKVK